MEQAGARTLTAPQYQQLVDRLLASSAYGERWARHWLDVVRYADTSGYERDQPKPFAWKYRDWVVQALNDDLPWDQFVRLQLAGDEVPDRSEQTVIATGFLRLGTWNDEPNDPEDYVYERLEDLVHTTSSAFLGLTVKCARCHDHKYDPVDMRDYYSLAGVFLSTRTMVNHNVVAVWQERPIADRETRARREAKFRGARKNRFAARRSRRQIPAKPSQAAP